jgi:transcription termination/antitermination protein NusG
VTDELNNLIDEPHDTPQADAGETVAPQVDEPTPSEALVADELSAPSADGAAPQGQGETPAADGDSTPVESTPIESGEVKAEAVEPVLPPSPPAEPAPTKASKAAAKAAAAQSQAQPPEPAEEAKSDKLDWYILKVQSNREDSIRDGLLRRVAIEGLGRYFSEVIVPTEKVTEFKGGKKRVTKRKLYPGYLVVHMEINDDTWFVVRETPGIGDFTGASGRPSPMLPHEVSRILAKQEEKSEKAPKLKIGFKPGDQVKINEGTFENFEGEVSSIDETNGRVTVMINIFGRSTPVELEYWQIGAV